jgi:hypothetical protein
MQQAAAARTLARRAVARPVRAATRAVAVRRLAQAVQGVALAQLETLPEAL